MDARAEEKGAHLFRMSEIYNFNTDKVEPADFWLSQDEETRRKLRYGLMEDKKSYGCPVCKTPVVLYVSCKGKWFFRHRKREEGVECALVDNHMPEERRRIQSYNAAVETEEHKMLKLFIAKYLESDPYVTGDVLVEKRVKGTSVSSYTWKRPDVSCTYGQWDFVFEVQISNTWLSDIVARDTFYAKEGKVIIWVFNSFDSCMPNIDSTKADIFYNNPEVNLFVLDETAMEASHKADRLVLNCYYRVPRIVHSHGTIKPEWHNTLVTLDQLQIAPGVFKPYFVPYANRLAEAQEELQQWQDQQDQEERDRQEAEAREYARLKREKEERLRREAAERLARYEAEQKERQERERREREDRERREQEWQKRLEMEEQARREAEAEEKRLLIEQLLIINPDLDANTFVEWSIQKLQQEVGLEEIRKAEREKAQEALRQSTAQYYLYKSSIKNDLANGQLQGTDGNIIASKKMTEYCLELLSAIGPSLTIDYQLLQKIGYCIAREFGQNGRNYFNKVGEFSDTSDYWELVRLYKHCLNTMGENVIDIREFWQYCFSVSSPDLLFGTPESQVA